MVRGHVLLIFAFVAPLLLLLYLLHPVGGPCVPQGQLWGASPSLSSPSHLMSSSLNSGPLWVMN